MSMSIGVSVFCLIMIEGFVEFMIILVMFVWVVRILVSCLGVNGSG